MSTNNGAPAFPYSSLAPDNVAGGMPPTMYADNEGMTLRDYFAAKALSGIANQRMLEHAMTPEDCDLEIINAAALSYWLADAMIKAREA